MPLNAEMLAESDEADELFDDGEDADAAKPVDVGKEADAVPVEAVAETEGEPGERASTGKTVLVADDSRLIRVAVRKIVEQLGHEVIEAADGAEAIVQAMAREPDMIFLDWVMPEKDGLEVLAQLHKMPQIADIPVCLLTSEMDAAEIRKAAKYNVKDYLSKPAHPRHIQEKVKKYLG